MKKKILFVNSSLTSGGSEKVMTILANEFCKADYDVTMLLVNAGEKENYIIEKKVKCIKFKYKFKNRIMKSIERICKIRENIKQNDYDCIISFMYFINTSTLIASLGTKVPVIVSERCDPAYRKINIFVRKIEDLLYMRAKKIVLQTEQVKSRYPKFLQNKFTVIPNPISNELASKYQGKRKHKIVAVGRLTNQKNFSMLINSFANLSNKYKDYRLYIYGEGPLKSKLIEQANYLKIENKVFFPGYVDNVNELMRDAKIYVSTSNYEGISNSMLEALAMGIPSICTDCPVGGAAMMIEDHKNGILIPVKDSKSLEKSMEEIIQNQELEKKLSDNAVLIRKRLNSKTIFMQWEELIYKIK